MTSRPARLAPALALVALAACSRGPSGPDDGAVTPPSIEGLTEETVLYFPADDGRLRAESRRLGDLEEGVPAIRRILEALLEGPRGESLHRPLPDGTTVASVRLSSLGVAYVDLLAPAESGPPRWGSSQEILSAYSVVHSICANLPAVESVAFLWNGAQPVTFAGQLDTRRPLLPDPAWIAAAAAPAADSR